MSQIAKNEKLCWQPLQKLINICIKDLIRSAFKRRIVSCKHLLLEFSNMEFSKHIFLFSDIICTFFPPLKPFLFAPNSCLTWRNQLLHQSIRHVMKSRKIFVVFLESLFKDMSNLFLLKPQHSCHFDVFNI